MPLTSPSPAPVEIPRSVSPPRLLFIDNLRWSMIILVISMHAADTYSPLGSWYFTDRTPLSPSVLLTFAAWQMYLQAFFMGLLFFVAGFFVPASFDRKGPGPFVRDRAFRLGLPVLLYMFVVGPVTEYFFAHSWTSTRPTSFANEWIKHIRNGEFLQENGPLWFCLALLIFSLAYAAWPIRAGSSRPTNSTLISFALTMAAFTFLVRVARPPSFLNMHLADFPQYILLFLAGILAARGQWIQKLDYATGIRWLVGALTVGFAVWLAIYIERGHRGLRQTAAFACWESFACVGISFGLLVFYREKFSTQGRLAKFLSANAFSVYVFHPPIVILGARLLHGVHWHPLLKFAALTLIGVVATYALSAAVFRRIPYLRAIL
jgi:glucans biosynthesis protein C